MDDWIEEIQPISSIRPTRKLMLPTYRNGEGQKYQFIRQKSKKRQPTQLDNEKVKKQPNSLGLGDGFSSEEVAELKRRIAFDRVIILGD